MGTARYEVIARLPDDEEGRESFPSDFLDPIDVPAKRHTDPGLLALEREFVLERSWLFVAHEGQIAEPGDFLKLDALERMGHPLFLVGGHDGKIRAFRNACRPDRLRSQCIPRGRDVIRRLVRFELNGTKRGRPRSQRNGVNHDQARLSAPPIA